MAVCFKNKLFWFLLLNNEGDGKHIYIRFLTLTFIYILRIIHKQIQGLVNLLGITIIKKALLSRAL